jgi:hypothetical protein
VTSWAKWGALFHKLVPKALARADDLACFDFDRDMAY